MSYEYKFLGIIEELESLSKYVVKLEAAKSSKVLKEKEEQYQKLLKANVEMRIELESARSQIHDQSKRIARMLEKLEDKNII